MDGGRQGTKEVVNLERLKLRVVSFMAPRIGVDVVDRDALLAVSLRASVFFVDAVGLRAPLLDEREDADGRVRRIRFDQREEHQRG